jgi:ketosteroid isomerase-like protein
MPASHATLKALVEAFNDHDLDRIMSFFADDAVLEMPRGSDPWGSRFVGAAAVREALRGRLAGLPDVHYGDDSHYVDGDMGISQWTLTGTPASGQPIEVRGCDFYTFQNGNVIKKDSFWKIVEK